MRKFTFKLINSPLKGVVLYEKTSQKFGNGAKIDALKITLEKRVIVLVCELKQVV